MYVTRISRKTIPQALYQTGHWPYGHVLKQFICFSWIQVSFYLVVDPYILTACILKLLSKLLNPFFLLQSDSYNQDNMVFLRPDAMIELADLFLC